MNVRKAVILTAGYGTRLLPATKAQPKRRGRGKRSGVVRWSIAAATLLTLGLSASWLLENLRTTAVPAGDALESTIAEGAVTPSDLESIDGGLTAGASMLSLSTTEGPGTARTTLRLNLRIAPHLDSRVIKTLPTGTELELVELDGEWHLVRSSSGDRLEGWVHSSGVDLSAAPREPETAERSGE